MHRVSLGGWFVQLRFLHPLYICQKLLCWDLFHVIWNVVLSHSLIFPSVYLVPQTPFREPVCVLFISMLMSNKNKTTTQVQSHGKREEDASNYSRRCVNILASYNNFDCLTAVQDTPVDADRCISMTDGCLCVCVEPVYGETVHKSWERELYCTVCPIFSFRLKLCQCWVLTLCRFTLESCWGIPQGSY